MHRGPHTEKAFNSSEIKTTYLYKDEGIHCMSLTDSLIKGNWTKRFLTKPECGSQTYHTDTHNRFWLSVFQRVLWPRKSSLSWACFVIPLRNPCVKTLLQSDYRTFVHNTPQWNQNENQVLISLITCMSVFSVPALAEKLQWVCCCCVRDVAECHDDLWGGEDADGVWRPEDHREAVWEWQRWRHRDNQEQDQEECEWVTDYRQTGREVLFTWSIYV